MSLSIRTTNSQKPAATPAAKRSAGLRPGRRKNGLAAEFLAGAAPQALDQLSASQLLKDFLPGAGTLTLAERRLIVEQATLLIEQNYAHLPLKVAMHAVNPVQKLRLLAARLDRQTKETMGAEPAFHAEMAAIFHSLRDLHTNYLLPLPFAGKIAYLPFLVEEFQASDGPKFVVSHLMQGFSAPGFGPGAELTHWAGMPISRAVEVNGDRFAGSNAAARRARGVESLTVRSLRMHLPPDEEFVVVGYVGIDGAARELRQHWLVVDNLPPLVADDALTAASTAQGMDLGADEVARGKRLLFAPHTLVEGGGQGGDITSTMAGTFRARTVTTPSGSFGHIRIFTFSVNDPDAFVAEFVRLIGLLPQNGLIVDVRGNGGGHIFASEFLLQTMTPRHITPEPVQFINTTLNLKICRRHKDNPSGIDLGPWLPSMEQATETGSTFSAAVPITPEDGANALGQRYHGPVVLITDARCYSATDILAAGFQDHAIGPVIGVDDNTGAGGANVWEHRLLKQLFELPTVDAGSPYKALPKQAGMRVSIRRTLRVGARAGTPVEDLGVVPDIRHKLTRNDVVSGNVDLLARAGQVLTALPVRKLQVVATPAANGALKVDLSVQNIDRADVYVDARPRASIDIGGATATLTIANASDASRIRVEGFAAGQLVASLAVAS